MVEDSTRIDQSQRRISEKSSIIAIHQKLYNISQPNWPARLGDMLLYRFSVS